MYANVLRRTDSAFNLQFRSLNLTGDSNAGTMGDIVDFNGSIIATEISGDGGAMPSNVDLADESR